MSVYKDFDIDLQEMLATVLTVASGYDLDNPDSESGMEGRAVLLSRLLDLGWLTPTERRAALRHFNKGDGKPLLSLLGGLTVDH